MSDFQRPRGTRDFPPEAMEIRRAVESTLNRTGSLFGFREVATPTFESTDLFVARSGEEIIDEMYEFEDKGGRRISLRPEITASVIRFYVNELHVRPKPLKLFYMGNCFRYERPQSGRYREFWQWGAEIIGSPSLASDAEVLALACNCVKAVGLTNFKVRVGHLGVLKSVFDEAGLDGGVRTDIRRLIDKEDFEALGLLQAERGFDDELVDKIIDLVNLRGGAESVRKAQRILGEKSPALKYLNMLLERLESYGICDVQVDFGVARGLDYYTGMVFEIDAPALGAEKQICGGGSYVLSTVFGGAEVFSTGFAFGFDRLILALEKEGAAFDIPKLDAYVIPIGPDAASRCLKVVAGLRDVGVSADLELMGRKMGKAMSYASSLNVSNVIIVGDQELAEGKATVKHMESGEQVKVPFGELADLFN